MSTNTGGADRISVLLRDIETIVRDAQHLVDNIPNVEPFAVRRSLKKLELARKILAEVASGDLESEEIEAIQNVLNSVWHPLHIYEKDLSNKQKFKAATKSDSNPGRPVSVVNVDRAVELHNLGNTWKRIAEVMGVSRGTLYNHLEKAGLSPARPVYSQLSDEALDELVAGISLLHPNYGSGMMYGALQSSGIRVPVGRIRESLQRVDPLGTLFRWHNGIRRRVYKVRGSNALWHMDGNEKLRPWGFYIHGCIDGHSRMIIYLQLRDNKRAATVEKIFMKGVKEYGWPSRVRGDYGTENNGVERQMIGNWGEDHKAFLRGRSVHNVRIERLWRDVRTGALDYWRAIFLHLEQVGALDMEDPVHRLAVVIIFQPRIQDTLDKFIGSWNRHKIRTEHNKSPNAIYELSKEEARSQGYWVEDPGDEGGEVDPLYGFDEEAAEHSEGEPSRDKENDGDDGSQESDDMEKAREILKDFPANIDDENNGIYVLMEAIHCLQPHFQ